jgi:uncharacterized protein YjiS (DUF1127 family)
MESDMSEELSEGGDGRRLPPERLETVKAQARERAYALRAEMLREFGRWLVHGPEELARRFLAWRQHRKAVRELQGLDYRTLRDMGIARSEIEYLVAGGDPERRMPRRAAAQRAPCATPAAARGRHVTERRAA